MFSNAYTSRNVDDKIELAHKKYISLLEKVKNIQTSLTQQENAIVQKKRKFHKNKDLQGVIFNHTRVKSQGDKLRKIFIEKSSYNGYLDHCLQHGLFKKKYQLPKINRKRCQTSAILPPNYRSRRLSETSPMQKPLSAMKGRGLANPILKLNMNPNLNVAFKSNTKIYPFTERPGGRDSQSIPRGNKKPGLRIAVGGNEDSNHNHTDRPNLNHAPKLGSGSNEDSPPEDLAYRRAKLAREAQALDPSLNKELNGFANLLLTKLKSPNPSEKKIAIDLLAFFLDKKFSKVDSEAQGREA